MRILGIDPGYDRLGLAVVEQHRQGEQLVSSTCAQTDSALPFAKRLGIVGDTLAAYIRDHAPEHVALENVFFNTNQKTAMDVAAVRGVIIYLAHAHALPVYEYTPPQIKTAIAGNGRASKHDVMHMLHRLITLPEKKRLDDEYDAIAVALTHSAIHTHQ